MWRSQLRGVVALSALGLTALLFPEPGYAQQEEIGVLQWNMAGAVTHLRRALPPVDFSKPNNCGSLQVADRAASEVLRRGARVVSLNEVCIEQVWELASQLSANKQRVETHFANTGNALPCCVAAGSAIVAVNPNSVTEKKTFYFDNENITDQASDRAAACMLVDFPDAGQTIRVCSAHLHTDHELAARQASALTRAFDREHATILIGDFNASPEQLNEVYSSNVGGTGRFYEVDMNSPDRGRPTIGTSKFDYIFGDMDHFSMDVQAEAPIDPDQCRSRLCVRQTCPCSDHRMLFGRLRLLPATDDGIGPASAGDSIGQASVADGIAGPSVGASVGDAIVDDGIGSPSVGDSIGQTLTDPR